MSDTKAKRSTQETPTTSTADAIEQRVVALAEQLGRLVGSVQARTDGMFDRQAMNDQLTRIRDGATGLLGQLGVPTPASRRRAPKRKAKAKSVAAGKAGTGRSGGKVDAPGKAHRKAPPRTRSVKHSDQTISKTRAARQTRRAPRG
jgi:hypothetical protein